MMYYCLLCNNNALQQQNFTIHCDNCEEKQSYYKSMSHMITILLIHLLLVYYLILHTHVVY